MIDTRTEAVKALMNGVTPGDWRFFQGEDDAGKAYFGVTASSGDICSMSNAYEWRGKQTIANARFIEAARDLVPALLAERNDLRDKLDAAVDGLRKLSTLAPVEKPPEPYDENGWQVADTGERHAQMVLEKHMWSVADFARATIAKIKGADHE